MKARYRVETKTYDKAGTLILSETEAAWHYEDAIEYYELQKRRAAKQDQTKVISLSQYSGDSGDSVNKYLLATETINPTRIIKGN